MLIKPLILKLSGSVLQLPSSSKFIYKLLYEKKNKKNGMVKSNKMKLNKKDYANKYPKQGSGMISSISYSNGIIEIDEQCFLYKKVTFLNFMI